ncbi:hypothetical protein ACS0TY_007314 [Phlomoides rotata]
MASQESKLFASFIVVTRILNINTWIFVRVGSIWIKTAEEITNIMEGIASNSFQFTMDRGNHHRVAQVEDKDDMKMLIMTLMQKVEAISTSSQKEAPHPFMQGNSIKI